MQNILPAIPAQLESLMDPGGGTSCFVKLSDFLSSSSSCWELCILHISSSDNQELTHHLAAKSRCVAGHLWFIFITSSLITAQRREKENIHLSSLTACFYYWFFFVIHKYKLSYLFKVVGDEVKLWKWLQFDDLLWKLLFNFTHLSQCMLLNLYVELDFTA